MSYRMDLFCRRAAILYKMFDLVVMSVFPHSGKAA